MGLAIPLVVTMSPRDDDCDCDCDCDDDDDCCWAWVAFMSLFLALRGSCASDAVGKCHWVCLLELWQ